MMTNDPKEARKFAREMGPSIVDTQLRQALMMCWMILPEAARTTTELELTFRRLVDRVIRDAYEDGAAFGIGVGKEWGSGIDGSAE